MSVKCGSKILPCGDQYLTPSFNLQSGLFFEVSRFKFDM
jgi:hypothetical protein